MVDHETSGMATAAMAARRRATADRAPTAAEKALVASVVSSRPWARATRFTRPFARPKSNSAAQATRVVTAVQRPYLSFPR
jgi:hypothetical protein